MPLLYNELLFQRKLAYEELDISLSKYEQSMLLPLLKEERPSLHGVNSQVLLYDARLLQLRSSGKERNFPKNTPL
jgi:hypothetical protein